MERPRLRRGRLWHSLEPCVPAKGCRRPRTISRPAPTSVVLRPAPSRHSERSEESLFFPPRHSEESATRNLSSVFPCPSCRPSFRAQRGIPLLPCSPGWNLPRCYREAGIFPLPGGRSGTCPDYVGSSEMGGRPFCAASALSASRCSLTGKPPRSFLCPSHVWRDRLSRRAFTPMIWIGASRRLLSGTPPSIRAVPSVVGAGPALPVTLAPTRPGGDRGHP